MKSSLRSDEVQGVALDEVKSVLLLPCEAGSHRESDRFPLKTDLITGCSKEHPALSVCGVVIEVTLDEDDGSSLVA